MNDNELRKLLELAAETARKAGALLEQYSHHIDHSCIECKSSHVDLVSGADRDAEALIRKAFSQAAPEFGFIGEESVEESSMTVREINWIVDPLDGTSNFLCGLPIWSVSIALCSLQGGDHLPLVGAICAPLLGKLWTAAVGQGAKLNGKPIAVRQEPAGGGLENAMIATGFPYSFSDDDSRSNLANFSRMQRRFHKIRRLGSAAIDLAFVADGTYDGMWELGLKLWDISAGRLMITEAGGALESIQSSSSPPEVHILAAARPDLMEVMRSALEFPTPTLP